MNFGEVSAKHVLCRYLGVGVVIFVAGVFAGYLAPAIIGPLLIDVWGPLMYLMTGVSGILIAFGILFFIIEKSRKI